MESEGSDDQWLFTAALYALYIMFLAFLYVYILQFSDLLKANSSKPIVIAVFLLVANVFVARPGLQLTSPNPILFYTTMISAPGVILYTMEYIRRLLIASDDQDYLPM